MNVTVSQSEDCFEIKTRLLLAGPAATSGEVRQRSRYRDGREDSSDDEVLE